MTDTEKGERVERWILIGFVIAHLVFSVRAEGSTTKGEWMILAWLIMIMMTLKRLGRRGPEI